MLKWLAILAVFLTVAQTLIPIEGQTADSPRTNNQKESHDSNRSQNPSTSTSPVSIKNQADRTDQAKPQQAANNDQHPTVNISNSTPVSESWPWYQKVSWGANVALALSGIVGIWIALCSLTKVGIQANAARDAAKAARESAKAAFAQIQFMKDKERARFQVDIDKFEFGPAFRPMSMQLVNWNLQLHGQTEALDVSGQCFACIGDPFEHDWFKRGYSGMSIPSVISPVQRAYQGSTVIHFYTASGEDVGKLTEDDLRSGSATLYCAGSIRFTDVFGQKWVLPFRKRWVYYQAAKARELLGNGVAGYWHTEGDNDEQQQQ